jgi:membrane protein DedA with SNARE-associated domain
MTELLIHYCRAVIEALGYPGIFVLMFAESTWIPLPSFAVMPFVGFSASQGGPLDYTTGIIVGAAGGLAGSLTTYAIGYFGGPAGVRKIGRYAGLDESHLEATRLWLAKHGTWAILLARFIPVIRHFISTVAGMGRMKLLPFVLMTTIGAACWATILTHAGWVFGKNYGERIHQITGPLDVAVLGIIGFTIMWWFWRLRRKRTHAPAGTLDAPKASP